VKKLLSIYAFLLLAGGMSFAASGYHLLKKIPIGGQGGWDYLTVDEANRRLYVSHETQVEVVDIGSGTLAGKIPDTQGVHGIAIAQESGRGFISAGRANSVTIFNLKSLETISRVSVGTKPDAIVYDPASRRVFAMNGGSESSTAIDAASGSVAGTVALGGGPEFATADGSGNVFVNLEDESLLVRIDSLPKPRHGGRKQRYRQSNRHLSNWRPCGRHRVRSGHNADFQFNRRRHGGYFS